MVVEINNESGSEHQLNSGIPQGSPVSPILFAVYMSELFDYVEQKMGDRIRAISFVDDIAWRTSAKDTKGVQQQLEEAAHTRCNGQATMQSPSTQKRQKLCGSRGREIYGRPTSRSRWAQPRYRSTSQQPGG